MQTARLMGRCRFAPVVVAFELMRTLAASPSYAQETAPVGAPPLDLPPPTRALSMPEALAYAHDHQPAIHAAVSRIAARIAAADVPSGQWLPTIGLTAQIFAMTANNTTTTYAATPYMDIPRIGATAATAHGSWSPYGSTLVGAGLTQEVFDFGRIGAQRAAADALVDIEKHRADETRLDVDFGVEESYFAVSTAKAVVATSDEAYERSRVHRDFAKRGVDAGLRPPIELTRAEADLARFEVGRLRARGGLAVAQSVLSAAIGAPDAAVDIRGESPLRADMPALDAALQMAEARDPRMAEVLSQLRAAEQRTRAIGAEMRPDVSLTATLSGRAGGAPPSSGPVPTGSGWAPDVPNWDAGLVLSWPIFDGTISARRDAAYADQRVRRDDLDVVREQEVAGVRQGYLQVEVARSALVGLGNAVVAARANYDQADARFRAGIGTAVEHADAEAIRTDSEIQLALGRFAVARARAAFGRLIAEGL
jgi:outer membrane protein